MGQASEIAIIGGGAIGLCCAWRLAQVGAHVTLLERGAVGAEASFAAGGMLAPEPESVLHPCVNSAEMLRLGRQSRDLYPALAAELLELTGIDIELCLHNSPTRDWREPGIRMVCESATGAPWKGRAAQWFERDGQVEPRQLVAALRAACEKVGVCLRENTLIQAVDVRRDRVRSLILENEWLKVNQVLLCAGAWSAFNGLPSWAMPPVRPVAGQMLQLRGERRLKFIVYSADCYLIPRRDGRLLVGATVEETGFQKAVTAAGVAQLLNAALELAPMLRDAAFETSWAGLRPVSLDGLPILGGGPLENLSYATGHGRNGILLAPITAQLIVGQVLRGEGVPDAFGWGRFGGAGADGRGKREVFPSP